MGQGHGGDHLPPPSFAYAKGREAPKNRAILDWGHQSWELWGTQGIEGGTGADVGTDLYRATVGTSCQKLGLGL